MTTDHDLDARLSAANGVRSDELPLLPDDFLSYLQTSGSDAEPVAVRPHSLSSPTQPEPASVLAARQLVADAHARRHRPTLTRRRAVVAATATAAAAALVFGITTVAGTSGSPSAGTAGARSVNLLLADYSATPTPASDERKVEVQLSCATAMTQAVAGRDPSYADQSPATITEVRDNWGLSIFNGKRNFALCLVHHSDATGESVEGISVNAAVAGPPVHGITIDSVANAKLTNPERTAYTAVVGRTAGNVDSVALRLGNGQTIAASVNNGWWAAWWPTDGSNDLTSWKASYITGTAVKVPNTSQIVTRIYTPGK